MLFQGACMKIFQVINVRWYNATAWYCVSLSHLLQRAGHDVLVIGQEGTPPLQEAERRGLRTMPLDLNTANPLRLGRSLLKMRLLMADLRPEIVNCHRGEGFILWGLLRHLGGGFKLVRTRGDQRPPKADPLNRWLHNNAADAVVATCGLNADICRQNLALPPQRLWLIHGGVDVERFRFDPAGRERVRREFGFSDSDVVFGLLGRFDQVKGQRECLQALARLRAKGRNEARLLLIGHDSALGSATVREWIDELDLVHSARITGRREDVAACISALDIGVVASLWSETIARAALEIMACGRPLLSTRVGVMPDLLTPQALCAPDDVGALGALMERALVDPRFLHDRHTEQQKRMTQLSEREFLRQTLSLYQSLLAREA
jgi:glycosyltransferase involved in cell wall biosynthesis